MWQHNTNYIICYRKVGGSFLSLVFDEECQAMTERRSDRELGKSGASQAIVGAVS